MLSIIRGILSGQNEFIDLIVYLGATAFVVFCTLPLHEYAHAFVATKLGDDTPRKIGRLTINPMSHVHPIGALMIFLCGFGYAKPVPVRMRNFKNPKRDMAIVALAGPLCNILQAFVCLFLFSLIGAIGNINPAMGYIALFFYLAADVNIGLAVFNLLPIPPLDGSRLLTALLPAKQYFKVMQHERQITLVLFVLIITGILSTPLDYLSSLLMRGLYMITQIPF